MLEKSQNYVSKQRKKVKLLALRSPIYILLMSIMPIVINASEKVLIITHAYNRPDFIEIHDKTFKAFLEDDYEFVVFNDARNKDIRKKIQDMCRKLNLRCIDIPQAIHDKPYLPRQRGENFNDPCVRCANVVQYSLDVLGFDYPGIVAIIDSDMFLMKKFSIKKHLEGYDLFGCYQSRAHVEYVWNGLVFMNMKTLPNRKTMSWNSGTIEGQAVDVGGYLYYYLKNNPSLRASLYSNIHIEDLPTDVESLRQLGYDAPTIRFIKQNPHWMEFHVENHFLHYRAGGNWANQSAAYHAEKTRILNDFINTIIQQNH